uniref:TPM domain-containing protein n=1 Tax=Syphacia muris TaxID=451379 RepID=A0A0N5AFI7_9BILA
MQITEVLCALSIILQIIEMKHSHSSERISREISISDSISSPCHMQKPSSSSNFAAFCQFHYHEKPYVCDPSGSLSRTEIEMLDAVINPLNISSCFCQYSTSCHRARFRMSIVIVPYTSAERLKECGYSMSYHTPHTWSQIALTYAEELSRHWMDECKADILLVYIAALGPEKINKAFMIPIFRNNLRYLSHYSQPISVPPRRSIYSAVKEYLNTLKKLISSGNVIFVSIGKPRKMQPSIPPWAIFVSVGFIALAICSVFVANCLTNRTKGAYWQSRYPNGTKIRLANERWRAGFGGGLMMQNNNIGKGAMMFKQFGGRRSKQSETTRKI